MTIAAINRLIAADRESPKRIAVVGDRMEDQYIHGTFDVCQEECYKFREECSVSVPGGAANAARQLQNWNASVALFSNHKNIQPIKTRYLVNGKFVFRHDLDDMDCEAVLKEARKTAMNGVIEGRPDGILLSDYWKGFLTQEIIIFLIGYANDRKIPIVADAKQPSEVYEGSVLKCNHDYFIKYSPDKIGNGLFKNIVVTLGNMPPVTRNKKFQNYLKPVEVKNHVGAGDCFASHLLLALVHGLSIDDAAAIAHSAGRVYVQFEHGRPPWPHELRRDLDPIAGKIQTPWGLTGLHRSLQDPKRSLVVTNGCFDMLHNGHVHCLQEAKKMGDVLCVLVNDDESVCRLKGPVRPIVPLAQRMAMLAALDCVDWVCPFSEDTPAYLLNVLRPDIRVKGATTDLNGAGDEHCGEVRLVPLMAGWSTTETIGRIRNER